MRPQYVLPMHQSFPQTMQVFTGGTPQVQPVSTDNAANPGQPSMGAKSAPQFAPPPAPKLQQQQQQQHQQQQRQHPHMPQEARLIAAAGGVDMPTKAMMPNPNPNAVYGTFDYQKALAQNPLDMLGGTKGPISNTSQQVPLPPVQLLQAHEDARSEATGTQSTILHNLSQPQTSARTERKDSAELPEFLSGFERIAPAITAQAATSKAMPAAEADPDAPQSSTTFTPTFTTKSFDELHTFLGRDIPVLHLDDPNSPQETAEALMYPMGGLATDALLGRSGSAVPAVSPLSKSLAADNYALLAQQLAAAVSQHSAYAQVEGTGEQEQAVGSGITSNREKRSHAQAVSVADSAASSSSPPKALFERVGKRPKITSDVPLTSTTSSYGGNSVNVVSSGSRSSSEMGTESESKGSSSSGSGSDGNASDSSLTDAKEKASIQQQQQPQQQQQQQQQRGMGVGII